jgi:hypothetical protein
MNQPTDGTMPDNDPSQPAQSGPMSYTFPGATEPVELTDPSSGVGDAGSAAPPRRKTNRALLVGGVATVLALGVGGAVAIQQLSGSGPRPSEVLPGDTFGYVQVDIDPSAGQKLAAVRFLGKIPEIKDLESGDARKKLWDLAVAESEEDCVKDFDFARDIDPWLGDRVGVGLRPGGTADEPNVVAALQVKDQDQALSTLGRLADCGDGSDALDLRAKDGYVLLTAHGQGDATLAAIDKGTLSQNGTFTGDMTALGEQGVAATWWDMGPAAKELSSAEVFGVPASEVPQDLQGRVAAALRFDPGYAEIAGIARGFSGAQSVQPVDGDLSELTDLPDDTLAAAHFSGGAQLLDQAWPQLKKQIDSLTSSSGMDDPLGEIEDQLGLALPDDLKVLLGSSFTLSLPDQEFGSDVPALGVKVVTSDAKRAEEVVTTIEDAGGAAGILTKSVDGGKLYVATTPDYVTRLKSGGNLGGTDGFKAALGDATDADYAVYVDLDRLEKLYLGDVDGDARAAVEAMRSVGISSTVTGQGEAKFALRLVAN